MPRPKPKTDSRVPLPPGRALRYDDLTPQGRNKLDQRMAKLGNARSGQAGLMRGLRQTVADPDRPEKARDAAARRLVTHGAMKEAGAFVNKPVTMDTAVESQLGLIHRGIARGRADAPMTGVKEGSGSNVAGLGHLGADWYFQHNAKLGAVAAQTGIGKPEVIAGSAVMSPQNNPVQELAAVGSLARAHADPAARVKVTPQAVAHSEDKSIADWSGRSVHPTEMMSSQFAALKAPEVRPHVGVKGDVDLATMAKGGTTENVTKAVDVLRGNTPAAEAIDPHSSPKVHSYHAGIAHSDTADIHTHEEFLGRMDNALRQVPGQQRMDTFGLKGSTEGILSPTHPIANDTWMQAAQSGQQVEVVDTGRAGKARFQSPAKFGVGEAGAASEKRLTAGGIVKGGTPPMLRHAWGQESVERVARKMSEASGEIVPSVGAQAVAWTEIRRQAGGGKDAEYEAQVAAHHAANRPMTTTSVRNSRFDPTAVRTYSNKRGAMVKTEGTHEVSYETHPTPGKGQGTMLRAGEGGTETVNPQAVLSESRQKGLNRAHARGVQGSLFG
jgi:hypothetical protein